MDSFNLSEDLPVMCVTADSFPNGIESAHQQLHQMLDSSKEKRDFFGISHPDKNGKIIYKAAATEIESGEAARLGLETFTIKKGSFNSFFIKNFRDDIENIREAFEILLKQPEVDPEGYCLEWYIGHDDVKCMVPLDEHHSHFTGLNNRM